MPTKFFSLSTTKKLSVRNFLQKMPRRLRLRAKKARPPRKEKAAKEAKVERRSESEIERNARPKRTRPPSQ